MLQRLDSIIVSLYIDPGTGAMLFSVLMGIASAGFFLMQKIWHKIKFIINGGLAGKAVKNSVPYVIFSDSKRYWNVFSLYVMSLKQEKYIANIGLHQVMIQHYRKIMSM